jgi:hypothetical protein
MSIKFYLLWIMWASGVAYDIVISAMHWFPSRGLQERLIDDAAIAWFIITAWVVALWICVSAGRKPGTP